MASTEYAKRVKRSAFLHGTLSLNSWKALTKSGPPVASCRCPQLDQTSVDTRTCTMAYPCSAPISPSHTYDGLALDLTDHLPESCSSLGSGDAHVHASSSRTAVQPHFAAASPCLLAWDPTPSAPDLFREELISTLANECNARPTDDDFLAGLQTLSASFAEDQVAELEAVQESDAPGTSDRSPSCDSTNERRQESNRQAQKRWRSRQKVLLGQELQH